jgi:hypothetical protein
VSDLDDAGVATGAIFDSRSDAVEKVLHEILTVDEASLDQDLLLLKVTLSGQKPGGLRRALAMAYEHLSGSTSSLKAVLKLRKRDELFNNALKFLSSTQRGAGIAMANELALQVGEQSPALVARESELTAVNEVSHA